MSCQAAIINELGKLLSPDGRVDTSFSVVFLKGQRAYKVKRESKNGFLDFSTLAKRKFLCGREFEINKRNSPGLYRGVVFAYRGGGGALELWSGGKLPAGAPEEYMLEMNRFEEDQLLAKLSGKGLLTEPLCLSVAGKIAQMHTAATIVNCADYAGKFLTVVNIIIDQFRDSAAGIVPGEALEEVPRKLLAAYSYCRGVLARRGAAGVIRECHGDLHLGNICLFEGAPCIFDAVEFNTEFTHIDTLYDLSFLIMDLHHHGLPGLAEKISGKYLADTGTDIAEFRSVMPLYLGLRSIIRCSISAAGSKNNSSVKTISVLKEEALKYLRETLAFLS